MRLSRHFTFAAGLLLAGSLAACVSQQKYDALDNDYNALNLKLSGEIGAQQVHITRLQGAAFPVGRLADVAGFAGDDRENGADTGAVRQHANCGDGLYR